MSADNYYIVRKHPEGGYTYVMAFESDDNPDIDVKPNSPRYDSLSAALNAALMEYSEYGIAVHPECEESSNADITPDVHERRHDPLCVNVKGTCCEWMGHCECQCTCEWIEEIRADERKRLFDWVSKLYGRSRIWSLRAIKRKEAYRSDGYRAALASIQDHIKIEDEIAQQRSRSER